MVDIGDKEPAPKTLDMPDDLKAAVTSFIEVVLVKGVNADTQQAIYSDGNWWKIHMYRHDDKTIIIRLVNKGRA